MTERLIVGLRHLSFGRAPRDHFARFRHSSVAGIFASWTLMVYPKYVTPFAMRDSGRDISIFGPTDAATDSSLVQIPLALASFRLIIDHCRARPMSHRETIPTTSRRVVNSWSRFNEIERVHQ